MKAQSSKKKKLFVFHTEFLFLRGGEKYVFELIKRLSKTHTVILCVERISDYWKTQFVSLHVSVHHLWKPPHLYWLFLPVTCIINVFRLKKSICSTDVVFATSFPLSLLATFVSNKSIVFCFEPLSIFYDAPRIKAASMKEKFFLFIIGFIYSPLDFLAVKRATILATLNTPVASAIWSRYHRKPNVFIPNGVNTVVFTPSAKPLFHVPNPPRGFIIGHSTDYTVLKGTESLLRALPHIIKKQPNILLLISESIPNTKIRSQYIKLVRKLRVQKNVRFIGCVPEQKLPRFYTTCNVFCYCGSTQCVGGSSASLSVLEAESCGIPVLRTLGNSDEIVSGKTGFYFFDETPVTIAKGILQYMRLPTTRVQKMKRAARQHVMRNFSWEYSTKKLATLI